MPKLRIFSFLYSFLAVCLAVYVIYVTQGKAQVVTTPPQVAIVCAYNTAVPTIPAGAYGLVQCNSSGGFLSGSLGTVNQATSQVSVGTSATLIAAARLGRNAITITNAGTTAVWIGNAGVTVATGTLLAGVVGASITIPTQAAEYAVAGSAQTVSILETF